MNTCTNLRVGEGSGNNYAYLVVDEATKDATIIDPAHPPEYDRSVKALTKGAKC